MSPQETSPIIVHAIQLAIAPVFLLTGIGAMLGVMANRLARIIDRARALDQLWAELDEAAHIGGAGGIQLSRASASSGELGDQFLHRRGAPRMSGHRDALRRGIFGKDLKWLAGALFIGAMIALICGLTIFLREVYLATHAGRFETRRIAR